MQIDRTLNYGRQHVQAFLDDASPFRRVLDLGAGTGADLELAKLASPSAERAAVEVHKPYAERLAASGIQVVKLNIERDSLPFDSNSIDVVIANQVLEHTKEVFWIFHEVTRVLPVGGKFIVGVPNLASLHNRLLLAVGRQPSPIKTASAHVRGFTKCDLLGFLEEVFPSGYALVRFGGSNFYPFPPALAKPLARVFPSFAWGIFLMLEKQRHYSGSIVRFPQERRLETNFYLGPTNL